MWIKICGSTSVEDALLAADAGADAVGFVFAPSRRNVTPERAAEITPALPSETTQVGVFLGQTFEEIARAVRTAGLHGIQLHGAFDPGLIDRLRQQFGHRQFLIQTLHWPLDQNPADSAEAFARAYSAVSAHGVADAVLVDAKTAAASGGTGRILPWKLVSQSLSAGGRGPRVVLAGGLNPENVGEAIRTARPWGVDAVSGLESQPGRKDATRVRAFIHAARSAFSSIEKKLPVPQ